MRPAPLACSDSESRLALRYAGVFRATGRTVIVEALWVRPARAWALAAGGRRGVVGGAPGGLSPGGAGDRPDRAPPARRPRRGRPRARARAGRARPNPDPAPA